MATSDPTKARFELPPDPIAAPMARRHLRGTLDGWSEPTVDDASLMVTEVVANAVEHGDPPVELGISVAYGRACVAVHDANPALPSARALEEWGDDGGSAGPPQPAEHGRGLFLVSALSDRWGTERVPDDGKRVWFEVSDSSAPGARPSGGSPQDVDGPCDHHGHGDERD